MNKTIGEVSLETQAITSHILSMKPLDISTYEAIGKLSHCDVRGAGRYYLESARRRAEREGAFTECVPGVGIKRCDDRGILGKLTSRIHRVRRSSRRGVREIEGINYEKLSPEETLEACGRAAQIAIIARVSRDSAQRLLSGMSDPKTHAIPEVAESLDAMKRIGKK
jgi:hypothetical protein